MRVKLTGTILAGGLAVAAVWCLVSFLWGRMFSQNPQFEAKRLEIETGISLSEDKVRATTGLREGVNLFSFRASEKRDLLMGATLNVSNVEIEKRLPDTIRIVVRDRIPLVRLSRNSVDPASRVSSERFALDADGVVFTILDADVDKYRGLPVVENGASRFSFTSGQRLEDKGGVPADGDVAARVARALVVMKEIAAIRDLPFHVRTLDISDPICLEIMDRETRMIRLLWEEIRTTEDIRNAIELAASAIIESKGRDNAFLVLRSEQKVFGKFNKYQ